MRLHSAVKLGKRRVPPARTPGSQACVMLTRARLGNRFAACNAVARARNMGPKRWV
jgi:hypothetical protein